MTVMEILSGAFLLIALLWAGRILIYAASGQYEIDERLDAIFK
jgi:hypothetical protein